MKDSIVFILGLPLKIYVFGHIYLFLVNGFYPALKKHYLKAKRDFEAREKGEFTSKSARPILQKDFSTLKSVPAVLQKDFSKLNSVSAAVRKDFSRGKVFLQFCKKTFQHGIVFLQFCKKTFQHQKVFLQQFGYTIIRTWNSIYAYLHIYYTTSKSLSVALLIYIKTSICSSPFLHRNFPSIMRYISNRKQSVSS